MFLAYDYGEIIIDITDNPSSLFPIFYSTKLFKGHLVQFSIYANFDRVCGQNHRSYELLLTVS